MPAVVVPLVAAVAGAAASAGLATTLGTIGAAIAGALIATTISVAGSLIFRPRAPKAPTFAPQDRSVSVRQPITAWRVIYGRARVGGAITFMQSTDNNTNLHLVITLAGHEVHAIDDIYFGDEIIPLDGSGNATGKYAGKVRIKKALGTAAQTAYADLVAESSGRWTSDHRQRGRASIYVRLTYDQDLFASGIPNITAIVRGKKVYDPRTATTAYSANAALCLADYLTDATRGLGVDYATRIDATALTAAANICDEAVPILPSGTESRYECNGAFETSQRPRDVIAQLAAAMAGRATFASGRWKIYAGAYVAPTITLTESDLRGPIRVASRTSRRDLFNGVKGVFIDPDRNWQPTDFPAQTSAGFVAEDNGEVIWRDVEMPWTISPSMAQRLARIELRRARQQITVQMQAKLTAYRLLAGDIVGITNARFGWTNKAFEVADLRFAVADEGGGPALGVDLQLREIASTVYDWTTLDEVELDPAPDTDLPNAFSIAAPTGLTLASGDAELLELAEGSVISRIKATWSAAADGRATQYEVQWKRSADSVYDATYIHAGATTHWITPVEDGVAYDVRVRSISNLGVRSAFASAAGHVVAGKSTPPPTPNAFTVARTGDGTRRFVWAMPSIPADVRSGGGYRIRYSATTTSNWSAMTPLHEGLLISSPYETGDLAAGTYWFAVKSVDSSGNESTSALFINGAVLGDPPIKNVVLQRDERLLGWPATKTSCFVDTDSALHATSSQTWADLPATWSALAATWDGILNNNSPIRYETPVLDLLADISFTPLVSIIADGTATIEMKTGTQADGTVTGSYGPTGFVTGKRYVQIRVSVAGATPVLYQMSTLINSEQQIDEFEDINTATHSATYFNRIAAGHFEIGSLGNMAAISLARIVALQNTGAGWSWELISKTKTVNGEPAAEFKIYNASNTLADATCDIELRGPRS